MAFTRNPSDTSVTPATYTADSASVLFLNSQAKDIAIDGSDKSDTVSVSASEIETRSLTNYNIRGFEGDDRIFFADGDFFVGTTVSNSVINGNIGDDELFLGNFVELEEGGFGGVEGGIVDFNNSYLLGGKGDDSLTGDDVNGGEINGNIGDDTIFIDNRGKSGIGQYVGGGQGNDVITVRGNYTDSIIDGNKGIDTLIVEDGTHSGTSINGGEGGDIIRSSGDTSKGLMLSGDLGNDTIFSQGALGSTVFGGEGNDTIVSASIAGETSTIDAGVGADFVGTDTSAAVETIVFNAGDSVAATATNFNNKPGAAISGSITFANGIDVIVGLTGLEPDDTDDLIDIDFKPTEFERLNGAPNIVNVSSSGVYRLQGSFEKVNGEDTFTIGEAVDDEEYLYIVGGPNVPLGAAFEISTNMFISGDLRVDQFV